MTKQEFMSQVNVLEKKLRMSLFFGYESFGEFGIGYFYDEKERKWKVFINYDRTQHYIKLVTENETEVYDMVLKLMRYNIGRDEYDRFEKEDRKKDSR